jgi:heme ABC exporter ATP-binding subunit CcmA
VPLVVRLRSAVCLLGRYPALAGVDLDVEAGEVVLLSGANGSGKTTLLRLLAGLHPLHDGSAEVLGHDLSVDRRGARRAIGLLGHETGCYDDLTVRENLRFSARAAGRDTNSSDAVLERVGLEAQADVVHGRLSAGQRRRLALALTLAREPELLLLDEPHAGLDAAGRAVLDTVVASSPVKGRTVILASHELDRTRALAQREVTLAGGVVKDSGAAEPGLFDPDDAEATAAAEEEKQGAEATDAEAEEEKEPVTP